MGVIGLTGILSQLIETITLDIALMCFKSDFLEKRIQGLKMLQEITKQIKISKTIRHLTIEYMVFYSI